MEALLGDVIDSHGARFRSLRPLGARAPVDHRAALYQIEQLSKEIVPCD